MKKVNNCKRQKNSCRPYQLGFLRKKDTKMAIWNSFKVLSVNNRYLKISNLHLLPGYYYLEAKNNAAQALTEIEQAKLKVSHLRKELNEKEPQAVKAKNDNRGLLYNLESAKGSIQDLQVNRR